METHRRKKVEIVIESVRAQDALDWITSYGVTGHTLIPHVTGAGHQGRQAGDDLTRLFENVLIIAITREEIARRILEDSVQMFENYTAIVYLSDVEVARGEHF